MNLNDILRYSIVVVSVLLTVSVLLQNRSGGLGTVFGGMSGGEFYRSKRGLEAILYNSTIILGIIFTIICIAFAIINA
jgi:protein translocase SecG subunit